MFCLVYIDWLCSQVLERGEGYLAGVWVDNSILILTAIRKLHLAETPLISKPNYPPRIGCSFSREKHFLVSSLCRGKFMNEKMSIGWKKRSTLWAWKKKALATWSIVYNHHTAHSFFIHAAQRRKKSHGFRFSRFATATENMWPVDIKKMRRQKSRSLAALNWVLKWKFELHFCCLETWTASREPNNFLGKLPSK
jgi:hypothetical protein